MTVNRISRPAPGPFAPGTTQPWAPTPQKSQPLTGDLAARKPLAQAGFGPRLAKLPPQARPVASTPMQTLPFQGSQKLPRWPQPMALPQAMPMKQSQAAGPKASMFHLVVSTSAPAYMAPPPTYQQALKQPPVPVQFAHTYRLPPPPPYRPAPQPSALRPLPMFPQAMLGPPPYRPAAMPTAMRPGLQTPAKWPMAQPQFQFQPRPLPSYPAPPPYRPGTQWQVPPMRPMAVPQGRPPPYSPGPLSPAGPPPRPVAQPAARPPQRPTAGPWPQHTSPLAPATPQKPASPTPAARPSATAAAAAAAATTPVPAKQNAPVPTGNLAHMNLAARIKTTHLQVPQMEAQITFDDPKGLAKYGGTKENVVLQRLQMKAFEALNAASFEIKEAVEAYDRQLALRPPATQAEQVERQKTFEQVCRQILQAQEAKVNQAVQDEWKLQQHRDSALVRSNLRFGTKMVFNTTKLVASASTMATLGASPLGVASAAYTCYHTVQTIKSFMQDRDAARKSILKHDAVLAQQHQDELAGLSKGKRVGAELIAAMHLPFTKKAIGPTVVNQENKLEEFLAKSARVDRQARKLYQETNQLLQQIEKAQAANPNDPKLKQAGQEATQTLDRLADLMQSIERDNQFYLEHKARCQAYRNQQPVGMKPTTDAIETAAFAGQFVRFADNLHTIASSLA